jgi:heptosyltransferase-2
VTDARSALPGRVVIRAPNWLGDAVLALPAMTAVRRRFPGAHLTVAAVAPVAALFREDTDVVPDAVMELSGSSRGVVTALAAGKFDLGVLFPNSFRSAWQFRRAGIPARWGFATSGRGLLLTQRSPKARGTMHQSDYYRTLVAGLGAPPVTAAPRLAPSEASRARAAALLGDAGVGSAARLICLAPGAAYGSAKQWPTDRMAALAARLIREHDATCVIVGAGHDREAARAIESWLRSNAPDAASRAIDLVGRTSLGALVGVAAR